MPHDTPLIATIAIGLVLAFLLAMLANRFKISPLVGYLLAGIVVGPYTPGFVADAELSQELAEIGVILLMFGVGLHFSLKDLMSVKNIAVPGAIVQITVATLLGMALAWAMGWTPGAGLVFGLALSVASTVVLLRELEARRLIDSRRGRIAVGWLIVEDLVMVLALVLLPALAGVLGGTPPAGEHAAGTGSVGLDLLITLGKVVLFVAVMIVAGTRIVPWALDRVAGSGSRELFTLSVLAIAMGIAFGSAKLFGVSFALGAFFAGVLLNESEFSHKAAEDSLPMRDAFAVLFFVSVGMLFNPAILLDAPLAVLATVLVIVFGKSVAAYAIVRLFGYPASTALTISASLAQIGEFSFILAGLGIALGLISDTARDLVLAGAILSILINPLLFLMIDRLQPWLDRREGVQPVTVEGSAEGGDLHEVQVVAGETGHAIVVGCGRVGGRLCQQLRERGVPVVVVDANRARVDDMREQGVTVVYGHAVRNEILEATNIGQARWLMIAIPDGLEAGQIALHARTLNPDLVIMARAHFDLEVEHLEAHDVDIVVMGEREIARTMLGHMSEPAGQGNAA